MFAEAVVGVFPATDIYIFHKIHVVENCSPVVMFDEAVEVVFPEHVVGQISM